MLQLNGPQIRITSFQACHSSLGRLTNPNKVAPLSRTWQMITLHAQYLESEYEAYCDERASVHINCWRYVVCSLNQTNQGGVLYFLSRCISVSMFLPSRHNQLRRRASRLQQQAAPVSPTVAPETTVSRPKIKFPAVPPRMMAKMIKPLMAFVRRNSAVLPQCLLVVHGQQHEDISSSKLDSENRRT